MELHDNPSPQNPDETPTKEERRRPPGTAARALAEGTTALNDRELMALVLGDKVRAALDELVHADPAELVATGTLAPHQAAKLSGTLELCRRLARRQNERPRLQTATAIWNYVRADLTGLRREVFRVLCLDTRSKLLRDVKAAEGSVDSCHVDPREVFAPAVACRASVVVLVHNHPSGDPEPSQEDVRLTQQLVRAGEVLCVRVIDHLVVGETGYVSMMQRRLF